MVFFLASPPVAQESCCFCSCCIVIALLVNDVWWDGPFMLCIVTNGELLRERKFGIIKMNLETGTTEAEGR